MKGLYGNPGLGQLLQGQQEFYSRQDKERLNRDLLRAQAEQYRAKTQQFQDPRYLEQQRLSNMTNTQKDYAALMALPEEQRPVFMGLKRPSPQEYWARQGAVIDPTTGQPIAQPGLGGAFGSVEAGKIGAMAPAAADAAAMKTSAQEAAKIRTPKEAELGERIAGLPQLEKTVNKLSELGKTATYTYADQAGDFLRRQAGMDAGEGAVARREYMALVDNQILPLLRQTFGAAFTEKEGQQLKATLGDVNASPEEKDAVLRSFIDQKKQTIQSLERELGAPAPRKGQVVDGYLFLGGDLADQNNWRKVK